MNTTRTVLIIAALSALPACKLAGSVGTSLPTRSPAAAPPAAAQPAAAPPAAAQPAAAPPATAQPAAAPPATAQPAAAPAPQPAGPAMATKEQYDAYHALADRHAKVLRALATVDDDGLHGLPANPASAAEQLRALSAEVEAFSEYAQQCSAYLELTITDLQEYEQPGIACRDLERVDTLISKMAGDALRWFADQRQASWHAALETLQKGYPVADAKLTALVDLDPDALRAELRAELAELSELAGGSFAWDQLFTDLEAERDQALAAAPAASARFRFGQRPPRIAEKVARRLFSSARYRGSKPRVVAVLARAADWRVTFHHISHSPVARSHRLQAIVKLKGESFCRMYELDVSQRHDGSHWSKPTTAGVVTGARVVACK